MTGDIKWGSHPELMCMFSDSAVLIGHDGQRYEGRAAIIRRLNTGGWVGVAPKHTTTVMQVR